VMGAVGTLDATDMVSPWMTSVITR
jgi:hypothetical protein